MIKHYKIIAHGQIRGTNYRKLVQESANKNGIIGHIKYLKNGEVEILASGQHIDMQVFLEDCKKGNLWTIIQKFEVTPYTPNHNYKTFTVLHSKKRKSILNKLFNFNFFTNTVQTRFIAFPFIAFPFIAFPFIAFHFIAFPFIAFISSNFHSSHSIHRISFNRISTINAV